MGNGVGVYDEREIIDSGFWIMFEGLFCDLCDEVVFGLVGDHDGLKRRLCDAMA